MSGKFQIAVQKSKGNLHVEPKGDFDGNSAWELINLLEEKYDGQDRILIDTRYLTTVCPFGCTTFQCRLRLSRVPTARLLFQGEKGHKIAPSGCKVIEDSHKRRCSGQCANCPCSAN